METQVFFIAEGCFRIGTVCVKEFVIVVGRMQLLQISRQRDNPVYLLLMNTFHL
jgi:hypothetical protein